jgi:nonsense-mediated mRNA decay protein 3
MECYVREKPILSLSKKLRGAVCGDCGARKSHSRWIEYGTLIQEAIPRAAEEVLRESIEVEASEVELEISRGVTKKSSDKLFLVSFQVRATGKVEGFIMESAEVATVEVRIGTCDNCTRMKSGYYEAVLQVRGRRNLDREKKEHISRIVKEFLGRSPDKKTFVSKVDEFKGGIDYYLGSVKAARKLAKEIKGQFGGRVSESPKLVGRKGGKNVYRVNIAVRIR